MSALADYPAVAMPRKEHLPAPLRRRLVFGDREQIEAIRKIEEQNAKRERGEERLFSVDVDISFTETVQVLATCELEAEEMVNERLQSYMDEADVRINAREAKG
jgi:CRISPR/Cas system-associated protein Cas5 (RAMP superfamily)